MVKEVLTAAKNMWKPCSNQRKDDVIIQKIETKLDQNEEIQNIKIENMKGNMKIYCSISKCLI